MKTVSRWALSCAALLALSACGNKGPLVLPEKPAPVVTPTPTEAAAAAAAGKQGATPPVQIKTEATTTAPTSSDTKADDAIDDGDD